MALRASRLRHANPIIAIDKEEDKEDLAKEFGATHFICNSKENPVQRILEVTGGGAQFVLKRRVTRGNYAGMVVFGY